MRSLPNDYRFKIAREAINGVPAGYIGEIHTACPNDGSPWPVHETPALSSEARAFRAAQAWARNHPRKKVDNVVW